jgi:hypothetical protein
MAAIADEQRRAEAGLERLDLLRQRRRGDVQPLCRTAEVKPSATATKYRSSLSSMRRTIRPVLAGA